MSTRTKLPRSCRFRNEEMIHSNGSNQRAAGAGIASEPTLPKAESAGPPREKVKSEIKSVAHPGSFQVQTAEQPSIRPQTRYKPNEMAAALRAIASIGLSLWISALTCLLGCGQLLASSRLTHDAHSARTALIERPSCHHSHLRIRLSGSNTIRLPSLAACRTPSRRTSPARASKLRMPQHRPSQLMSQTILGRS